MNVNRRDIIVGAGAAGLTAFTPAASALASPLTSEMGPNSPRAVLQMIRLSSNPQNTVHPRLRTGQTPQTTLPAGTPPRRQRAVEATVVERKNVDGTPFAHGLAFACDPGYVNQLTVGGKPVTARHFCYSVSNINWSPGRGLPVYDSYCPHFEYDDHGYYAAAKMHQMVPRIGQELYFTGCQSSDVCESPDEGVISFDVNDSDYTDNGGYYVVTLWSWC